MARLPRMAVGGLVHYVLLRAHSAAAVFRDDDDRQAFCDALSSSAAAKRVGIHGYVLLDAEVHLLATPIDGRALGALMQALGRYYGARFNRKYQRSGTLWDGRYRAAPVEPDPWGFCALALIERAPVQAGLAQAPADYRWSSAAHHLGRRIDPLVTEHPAFWALGNTPFEREAVWSRRLDHPVPEHQASVLLAGVRAGWPVGSNLFIAEFADDIARPVRPRPRGRPRK